MATATKPSIVVELQADGTQKLTNTATGDTVVMPAQNVVTPTPDGGFRFNEDAPKIPQGKQYDYTKPEAQGEYVSAARKAMERIKSTKTIQSRTERVESNGFVFYIRKLTQPEMFKIGMLSNRNENGYMNILDVEDLKSFATACLYVAVASDEAGNEDAFGSYQEAYTWANEIDDDITEIVGVMMTTISKRNPKLVEAPRDMRPEESEAVEKKSESSTGDDLKSTT